MAGTRPTLKAGQEATALPKAAAAPHWGQAALAPPQTWAQRPARASQETQTVRCMGFLGKWFPRQKESPDTAAQYTTTKLPH